MTRAVFDANLLVSAFLSREDRGGVSNELLRFVLSGAIELCLSMDIIDETIDILASKTRLITRYNYVPEQIDQYRINLVTLASVIDHPPPTPGAVPRDPDDDKIAACAVAAAAEYIVTRDRDLLSLDTYCGIAIIAPEPFLHIVRAEHGRLPD